MGIASFFIKSLFFLRNYKKAHKETLGELEK